MKLLPMNCWKLSLIANLTLVSAVVVVQFATPADASPAAQTVAPLRCGPGAKVITLWPAGHPTLKNVDQKEVFKTSGDRVQSVTNVNNPSIELHLAPAEKANGLAVIVAPGGG